MVGYGLHFGLKKKKISDSGYLINKPWGRFPEVIKNMKYIYNEA